MIFKDPEADCDPAKPSFHVVRVQVKSGHNTLKLDEISTFLCKASCEAAHERYAAVLGVDKSRVATHRLLATARPLDRAVRSIFNAAALDGKQQLVAV